MQPVLLSLCDFGGGWSRPYIALGYRVVRVDPKHGERDQGGRGLTPGAWGDLRFIPMDDGGFALPMTAGAVADLLRNDPLCLGGPVVGILMAPPCTDFTVSGNQWWPAKDADGRTEASVAIVRECLACKDAAKATLRFWVLENPAGRLAKLVPELGKARTSFNPCDHAGLADDPQSEAYTKLTMLWGEFNPKLPKAPLEPRFIEQLHVDFPVEPSGLVSRLGKFVKRRGSWMWAKLGGKSEKTKELRSETPQGFARAFASANP